MIPVRSNDWRELQCAAPEPEVAEVLTISVLVSVLDGAPSPDSWLDVIRSQDYPMERVEILILDYRPTGRHEAALQSRAGEKWMLAADSDDAGVFHRAAQLANGQILIHVYAGMQLGESYLKAHARWHRIIDYAVVYGDNLAIHDDAVDRVKRAVHTDDVNDLERLRTMRVVTRPTYRAEFFGRPSEWNLRAHLAHLAWMPVGVSFTRRLYLMAMAQAPNVESSLLGQLGYYFNLAGGVAIPDCDARAFYPMTAFREALCKPPNEWLERGISKTLGRDLFSGYQRATVRFHLIYHRNRVRRTIAQIESCLRSKSVEVYCTLRPELGIEKRGAEPAAMPAELARWLGQQSGRVAMNEGGEDLHDGSEFDVSVPEGVILGDTSVRMAIDVMNDRDIGQLRLIVEESPLKVVCVTRRSASSRAALLEGVSADRDDLLNDVYGLNWADADEYGIATVSD